MKIAPFPLSACLCAFMQFPLVSSADTDKKMIRIGNTFSKHLLKWLVSVGILGVITYPIIFSPMIDPTKYQKIQKVTRQGIDQEKIQPGNMKIWTDPFGRK